MLFFESGDIEVFKADRNKKYKLQVMKSKLMLSALYA